MEPDERRIAVLIDGDNATSKLLIQMFAEVGKHGKVKIKRIYGDWTAPTMSPWKNVVNDLAITPVQQFAFTKGKNATDMALVIDAMDIMHKGNIDGFAIISSDSDFTKLVTRIKEEGLFVMGIGEKKTPPSFINACEQFVYSENLRGSVGVEDVKENVSKAQQTKRTTNAAKSNISEPEKMTKAQLKELLKQKGFPVSGNKETLIQRLTLGKKAAVQRGPDPKITTADKAIMKAIELCNEDIHGWVQLSELGVQLRKLDPAFDSRTYGHKRLTDLVKVLTRYEYKPKGVGMVRVKK